VCHIVLSSPILALPLFFFLPFGTALPAYLAVLVATGFVYFKIIGAMKSKVQTGMEGMAGREAVVVEDVNPEGKVRVGNEIWAATAEGRKFFKGQMVRIAGIQGLKVIVGDPIKG
jgi:membrane protein implicated in regulation of membrane protease activity